MINTTAHQPRTVDIHGILDRCAERFDWDFGGTGFDIAESIPCRTGTVYRVRAQPPAPHDIALKVCPAHWSGQEAKTAYEVLVLVHRAIASDPDVCVPVPLGWDDQTPSLCMSWIDGTCLRDLVKDHASEWGEESRRTSDLARRCGRAYGLLHAATQQDGEASINRLEHNTRSIGRRACSRPRALAIGLRSNVLVLRGPGSAPHNVVVSEDGRIALADSPRSHRMVSAHRALARFLVLAYTDAAGSGSGLLRTASMMEDFERAFLTGYAETAARSMDAPADAWLLTLHRFTLAKGITWRHLHRRKWTIGLILCAHAVHLRLQLARIGRAVILQKP